MTLYICATPIGNLEDASFRLVRILGEVDLIACEDTRHTIKLLNHFDIKNRTISYHQHNQREREDYLIEQLKSGLNVALVSDAGTPGISDPGQLLVKRARQEEIPVQIIPGPSALISALVITGMDTGRFVFEGFLPSRGSQRRKRLKELASDLRTLVFYESPNRLLDLLADLEQELGVRQVAVVRELTKIYEEVKSGSVTEVKDYYQANPVKGEITLVVEGASPTKVERSLEEIALETLELMEKGVEKKEALRMKALEYDVRRGDIYNHIVELKNNNKDF
ncbi:MAG: 16S rRNA (cytidine(1402)-2'-O)-methyltransferase [Candidatus Saccharibacteria bacterium]